MTPKSFGAAALAAFGVMYLSNIFTLLLLAAMGAMGGTVFENPVAQAVNQWDFLPNFLFGVIAAPILEELVFRKLLLDRVRHWGDRLAILISAAIAIFAAVGQWNAFQDTLMLMTDQDLYTLQYTLYQYINQASSLARMIESSGGSISDSVIAAATQQTPTSVRMTVSVVVVLPILLVYPIFQRFFVKGIMIGSVKG